MILILFLSIWTIVLAMENFSSSQLKLLPYIGQTPAFRDIVVALGSTYGAYIVASLLHYDPWHCFTSMAQYLLLLPSYVNVLMIYAFANISDTSWGTKGDNVITTGEGAKVSTNSQGDKVASLELPSLDAKGLILLIQLIIRCQRCLSKHLDCIQTKCN